MTLLVGFVHSKLNISLVFQVDCYSFGLLLCEMFSGELPDESIRQLQLSHVTNRTAQHLIRKCINATPDERPTMEEIIEQLRQAAQEFGVDSD